MKVAVFGTGYVGLITGVCFAQMGNRVTCVDIDETKVAQLQAGDVPIFEPGLAPLLAENQQAGRLHFTSVAQSALAEVDVVFIAVGTPPLADGAADMRAVLAVADTIAEGIEGYTVVVNKSTVPVGTADRVAAVMRAGLQRRQCEATFDVVSNPEFLKEGAAINDCMKPDRIILGLASKRALVIMQQLYAPFNRNRDKVMVMDVRSAELTKYAANAMLATKISFINEMSQIARHSGADIEAVRRGIGADQRIGYDFIYPGCGYGGSCFPKDVTALQHIAQQHGYESSILAAVDQVNQRQKQRLFAKVTQYFSGALSGKTVAIWGLAFKPNTDDIREAPSRTLIESLWAAGAKVRVYDPEAMTSFQRHYGERVDCHYSESMEQALEGADVLAVLTEWPCFRSPDFALIKRALTYPVIFDGRNMYDPEVVCRYGLDYDAIGRQFASAAAGQSAEVSGLEVETKEI